MKSPHWADLGETTFVGGIGFLFAVYRWFGRWPFRLALYPVVLYYWLSSAVARRSSLHYLQRLHEEAPVFSRRPGRLHSLRHFVRFGDTLLDKLLAMSGRYAVERLQFSGHEELAAAREAGQGGVLVTAHMGCLELLQTAAKSRVGLKLTVLVHTAHAQRFNRILTRLNPESTVRLLQVTAFSPSMAIVLAERVAAGEFIAIAGDRVPVQGERVARVPFLGKPAPFPTGPYLLAALIGCPLYAMACLRHDDGYRVSVERLAERVILPRNARQAALESCAGRFADWLGARVAESPFDWFNFFPFWDQDSHAHHTP